MGAPEPTACTHARLDYLDPLQRRGWVCVECGGSGPTTVDVTYDVANNVRVLCVCGSGMQWQEPATGTEVAAYLAEHADCKPTGATTAPTEGTAR